jgi:iron-sulfur cluster repair protein YtfE (RIC family)
MFSDQSTNFSINNLECNSLYLSEKQHAESSMMLGLIGNKIEKAVTNSKTPVFWPEIYDKFLIMSDAIKNNQRKEETIFFPFVNKLLSITKERKEIDFPLVTMVSKPIETMVKEHEKILSIMKEIRGFTRNFSLKLFPSEYGKLCLSELFWLSQHLERHFYFEENVLFEQVISLENRFNEISNGIMNNIVISK